MTSDEECVLLLGGFDGIHKGHKKLLDRALSLSLKVGITTITGVKGNELFNIEEREEIFKRAGIDFVIEAEFSESFKDISPEDFIACLISRFNVKAFVCGEDFRFGRDAKGDAELLKESGIPVYVEEICRDENGEKISSTSIKRNISEGRLDIAAKTMLFPFCVTGEVIHGRRMGTAIGFPTANMYYPTSKVKLPEGVYAVSVYIEGKRYIGIANYGRCPTFHVEYKLLESYIDGFSGNLYGERLRVYFHFRIRDVEKFPSDAELKAQLERDIERVREVNL